MHGYGEFSWKDGKKYAGYYVNDKKDGFGIYFWSNPLRVYIGFWKDGKQDGIGKYINHKGTKFGKWKNGERDPQWFSNQEDAFKSLSQTQIKFKRFFNFDLNESQKFLFNNQ